MIKMTKLFYPHVVKQYDTLDQLISENNYSDYQAILKNSLTNAGMDVSDSAVYQEALTDDKFEAIATIVYPDQATRDSAVAEVESNSASFSGACPIFEEEVTTHLF
ncbi:MAG: hypothetical protein CBB97_16670 [Candidatus Endolissoclinum sp. TMED37]|nr:MAG: hypothetical protein CBB97_16670 [Candidatus Endolissoclinum sp. TMED37]